MGGVPCWAFPNVGKGTNFLETDKTRRGVGVRSEVSRFN